MGRYVSHCWIGLLGLSFLVIVAIAAGCFDPVPLGRVREENLLPESSVISHSQFTTPLTTSTYSTLTIQAAARIEGSGAWALHLDRRTRIEIDSAGYVGVLVGEDALVPMVPFPHLRLDWNAVRADILENRLISIRLNGEIFWQGSLSLGELELAISGRSIDRPVRLMFRPVLLFLPGL